MGCRKICNWGSIVKFVVYLIIHMMAAGMVAVGIGNGLKNKILQILKIYCDVRL